MKIEFKKYFLNKIFIFFIFSFFISIIIDYNIFDFKDNEKIRIKETAVLDQSKILVQIYDPQLLNNFTALTSKRNYISDLLFDLELYFKSKIFNTNLSNFYSFTYIYQYELMRSNSFTLQVIETF